MTSNIKQLFRLASLVVFCLAISTASNAQVFGKKKQKAPGSQYKVDGKSAQDYTYRSGGKRYNWEKKEYEYEPNRWVKRKDNYRGSTKSFARAKYNIKPPRGTRQPGERKGLFRKKSTPTPADSGTQASHTTY